MNISKQDFFRHGSVDHFHEKIYITWWDSLYFTKFCVLWFCNMVTLGILWHIRKIFFASFEQFLRSSTLYSHSISRKKISHVQKVQNFHLLQYYHLGIQNSGAKNYKKSRPNFLLNKINQFHRFFLTKEI